MQNYIHILYFLWPIWKKMRIELHSSEPQSNETKHFLAEGLKLDI